jgi:hypothetical protein
VDKFVDIVLSAEDYKLSYELHALNHEVTFIRDPGFVVRLETGQRIAPSDFISSQYANRYFNQPDPEDPKKFERKPIAKAWLTWPHRFELQKMEFSPGEPQYTEAGGYNTWPGWGVEPKKGDITPWRELLDLLFGEEKASRQWFERWLAIPLQQPGAKMHTAAVLWGRATGTGKSLVGYSMKHIYGETFREINETQLNDARMAWAEKKCFIMGDDVAGHEQRKMADRIKAMITQESLSIDIKYIPQYTVVDHVNYYFTSNHPDAFYIEDDDRRFFIHEVKAEKKEAEFYVAYRKWLEKDGGAAALMHHLQHLDVGEQTAYERAPYTAAKEAMIEDGKGELGLWVRRLLKEPDAVLRMGNIKNEGELWTSTDLVKAYSKGAEPKVTTTAMTRELKRAGMPQVYKGMQVPTKIGQLRMFAIRNRDHWMNGAKPSEMATHYEKTRVPPEELASRIPAEGRHRKF